MTGMGSRSLSRTDSASACSSTERAEQDSRTSYGSQGSAFANRTGARAPLLRSEGSNEGVIITISERHTPLPVGLWGTPTTFEIVGVSLRGPKMFWMCEAGVWAAMSDSGAFPSYETAQLCVDFVNLCGHHG